MFLRSTGIEYELGDPRCGLNLDLQYVGLGREEHAELQVLWSYLVGDSMCRLDRHFIGRALGIRRINGHADRGENIQVVGL